MPEDDDFEEYVVYVRTAKDDAFRARLREMEHDGIVIEWEWRG